MEYSSGDEPHMLKLQNSLLFPTLETLFTKPTLTGNIFTLNWDKIESIKLKKWTDSRNCYPTYETFPGTLPNDYSKWVTGMQFNIPQNLLDEIRYCSKKANEEWSRKKPDIKWEPVPALNPTASYIQKAFTLIADCLYDPDTNNFSRHPWKPILPSILAYKFWSYQVSPDKIAFYSGVDSIKNSSPMFQGDRTYIGHLIDFESHIESLKNINKKEEVKCQVVPEATLKTFLGKTNGSTKVQCSSIKNMANTGMMRLINAKLIRPYISSTNIYVVAEVKNFGVDIQDMIDTGTRVSVDDFDIYDDTCSIRVEKFTVIDLSGTPPPTIKLKVDKFKVTQGFIPTLKSDAYPNNIVKTIDQGKIKKARNEASKEESFAVYSTRITKSKSNKTGGNENA